MKTEIKLKEPEAWDDYEAALVDALLLGDVEPGSPEEVRLDALTTKIEAYEAIYFPADTPNRAEAIKFRQEQEEENCPSTFISKKT